LSVISWLLSEMKKRGLPTRDKVHVIIQENLIVLTPMQISTWIDPKKATSLVNISPDVDLFA
jgi:hypothetical protein